MPAPTRSVSTDRNFECRSSRYVSLGGKRIHYCVEGRGPALLLLHGVMGSLRSWQGWVDQLAPHYRIVRVDLPGFGNSGLLASDDYSPEHALELIDQICAHLHLEQLSIAGNSLGGYFAWYYAANRSERVEKLILLDPIGYPQRLPPLVSLMSLPLVGGLAGYLSPDVLRDRWLRASNPATMVQVSRQLRAFDGELARHIPRVRCPTLLMWGQEDRWVPVELLDTWRRDLPSAQVKVYPGVGHVPMEEIPELTALDAHAFLSGGAHASWDDEPARESAIPFVFARPA
ncbi:MAG TPA: alpha/beta hydrolase [Polyangiales bacterium]|nr:alpha/beta hydrolase [Polyangiales bacterium]